MVRRFKKENEVDGHTTVVWSASVERPLEEYATADELLAAIDALPDRDDVVIAYPDEGAMKRFHTFFEGFEEVVCTKVRQGDKRIVTLKEGEPKGKHVVIVDDLVQTGGTLVECGKVLQKHGAKALSAFCTHGVFPNESWKRFSEGAAKVRLVPVRPRSRCERRFLRTFPVVVVALRPRFPFNVCFV